MSKQKQAKKTQQEEIITFKDLGIKRPETRVSPRAFSAWVRVLLQNWRQGTVACKGRSDVAYSNKKPWKQKGTGRARAGSSRSPLWRGGGVAFGPQARVRTLKVSKKLKSGVLGDVICDYVENNRVALLDWSLEGDKPKTATAYTALKKAGLADRKVTLFLAFDDMVSYASFANISTVNVVFFDQSNVIDLLKNEHWAVLKKDYERFKEMVTRWI